MKPSILLIAIIFFSCNSVLGQKVDAKKPEKDTIPEKQYFFVIKIYPLEWKAITDTSSMVIGEFGRAMTVDNAQIYKEAMIRQLNRIASKITVDSVITKPIKN